MIDYLPDARYPAYSWRDPYYSFSLYSHGHHNLVIEIHLS